ncbi:LysR family transcriptional regulator [Hoeflea sp. TYP-13]|uniref:LysR family transcriptional regulator n=1 Tax=Hoeflea sp. TYP-13 TaxID=3230023 RepID=UPI0034C5BA55
MNLSFRQLRTFREVMRTGSISQAARALGRTQPSVSAMIANLESELGFDLFVRERKRLIPKPEAHYFLEEANLVLDRLAQSARTMQEIGNLERGRIRIACLPAASGFLMPRLMSRFVKTRPNIRMSLMMRSSRIIEELIASQQYDIGLAETPAPRGTISMQTFELNCVCAVHKEDPLASREWLSAGDLHEKPMAALFADHITLQKTKAAFADAKAHFNQHFELQTFLPALELVEQRLCYSVCDAITAASYQIYRERDPSLVFVPFRPTMTFPISILTPAHRPLSRAAEHFCEMLSETILTLDSATGSPGQFGPD